MLRKLQALYLRWRLQCLWSEIHAAQEDITLRRAQRLVWIEDAGSLADRLFEAETKAML